MKKHILGSIFNSNTHQTSYIRGYQYSVIQIYGWEVVFLSCWAVIFEYGILMGAATARHSR